VCHHVERVCFFRELGSKVERTCIVEGELHGGDLIIPVYFMTHFLPSTATQFPHAVTRLDALFSDNSLLIFLDPPLVS